MFAVAFLNCKLDRELFKTAPESSRVARIYYGSLLNCQETDKSSKCKRHYNCRVSDSVEFGPFPGCRVTHLKQPDRTSTTIRSCWFKSQLLA
eukprot:2103199-Amphidinium_carterae.1